MSIKDFYGGAIKCPIPETFRDVSNVRPVPDFQEVYFSSVKNESIICELLAEDDTREDPLVNVRQRFTDLAEANHVPPQQALVFLTKLLPASKRHDNMPADCTYALLVGAQRVAKFKDAEKFGEAAFKHVDIIMVNIRIPSVQTDLLLTWNIPHELMHVKVAKPPASSTTTVDAQTGTTVETTANPSNAATTATTTTSAIDKEKKQPNYCQALVTDSSSGPQKVCPHTSKRVQALVNLLPLLHVADWGLFA